MQGRTPTTRGRRACPRPLFGVTPQTPQKRTSCLQVSFACRRGAMPDGFLVLGRAINNEELIKRGWRLIS
eukprot:4279673-Lingulodinium_polyedra.AAC.1